MVSDAIAGSLDAVLTDVSSHCGMLQGDFGVIWEVFDSVHCCLGRITATDVVDDVNPGGSSSVQQVSCGCMAGSRGELTSF